MLKRRDQGTVSRGWWVGRWFGQFVVMKECFFAVFQGFQTYGSQPKSCFFLDCRDGRRGISLGLCDRGFERFRGFIGVSSKEVCATVEIEKLWIRRFEGRLHFRVHQLLGDIAGQPCAWISIDLTSGALELHENFFYRLRACFRCRSRFGLSG